MNKELMDKLSKVLAGKFGEAISDAIVISNSALQLAYDRSTDLNINPTLTFSILHHIVQVNLEHNKEPYDDEILAFVMDQIKTKGIKQHVGE